MNSADLKTLYSSTSGVMSIGGLNVHACITQSASGTTKFFEGAIGVTDAQAQAASTASGCTPTTPMEENGGNAFQTYAATLASTDAAVVDFSVGSWISQANLVALDRSNTARTAGDDLASIDALGTPYTGTAPNEAPNPPFYASTTFGRDLYAVIPYGSCGATCTNPPGSGLGVAGIKSLFVGSTAVICQTGTGSPQALANKFGFASFTTGQSTCGDVTNAAGGKAGNLYS
jgi:hypothetical protein